MKIEGVRHIAVIGAGMIGTSLAVLFTGHGFRTTLVCRRQSTVEKSGQQYAAFYQALMDRGLVTEKQYEACRGYLHYTKDYRDIADADYVFECASEDLEVKYGIYAEIGKYVSDPAAVVSTTSAMSADDLAAGMDRFAERLIVAHPFFPPHLVPYFEVVRSAKTAEGVAEKTADMLESAGRKVVILKKNAPGFIANRLQHALFREAINIVERGIADPRDVDKAAMYSFMPRYTKIGLFEHIDNSGVDLNYSIENYLFRDLCNAGEAMPMIRDLYEKKEFGVKSGKGVYDWSDVDMDDFSSRISEPYWSFFDWDLPEE